MCVSKNHINERKHHSMNDSTTPLWMQVPEASELVRRFGSAVDIPAFGGRLEVNWAPGARVTSVGGLVYFATFLKATGLFDRLCADFPVEYASNNASSKRDIVGTAVLAVLLGKTRYVHIEAIRHDEAAKELLGLDEVVSDATVRRAFRRGSERELDEWPSLLRGDVGYGSDAVMCEAESRGIVYLFKIRRSTRVRSLFKSLADGAGWSDCGFGWQAVEVSLRLDGWARGRRVLFIRRPAEKKAEEVEPKRRRRKRTPSPKDGVVVPTVPGRLKQEEFEFVKDFKGREWDYCALVTNDGAMDAAAISQLYRDRGDCENNFDEFKNQWGWAGFTTRKLKPCKAMARLIAIVANWWNVFCRLADPTAHREAITSRPAYMSIMGRIVESGRKRTIHLTSTHADSTLIQRALDTVAAFFRWLDSTAGQLDEKTRWTIVVRCAFRRILLPDPALRPLYALT